MAGKGRPPVDRAKLHLALELIRNGAAVRKAALEVGVGHDTLRRYGITKLAVKAMQTGFVILPTPHVQMNPIAESLFQLEQDVANSFRAAIAREHVPIIATVEALAMENERLQALVRASQLKARAKRLHGRRAG